MAPVATAKAEQHRDTDEHIISGHYGVTAVEAELVGLLIASIESVSG